MLTVYCPSCGAPVQFRSHAAVMGAAMRRVRERSARMSDGSVKMGMRISLIVGLGGEPVSSRHQEGSLHEGPQHSLGERRAAGDKRA